ncbi:acetyl-CoA carboxylase biotin carboxyl carrier protein [Bacillus fonticola]|uniref:acetyl-CoA carboxylase biotin carboxyl carrier protein n=1 Tax=Bacillus fonticola TaxID=2728853 RepID=UPI0014760D18|nr:acetyl-CoA carboxylase biotin carboxyl carrier protein [Bacillus fonticola]
MLKVQEIREIIKLIDQSSIDEFVYELDGAKIEMKKKTGTIVSEPVQVPAPQVPVQQAPVAQTAGAQQPAVSPAVQESTVSVPQPDKKEGLTEITSPMVGTFYQKPSPDADTYVKVGDRVDASTVVCIVEAMKLFNEIEAEATGEIVEILVKDGQLVEYGQPLFLVNPE